MNRRVEAGRVQSSCWGWKLAIDQHGVKSTQWFNLRGLRIEGDVELEWRQSDMVILNNGVGFKGRVTCSCSCSCFHFCVLVDINKDRILWGQDAEMHKLRMKSRVAVGRKLRSEQHGVKTMQWSSSWKVQLCGIGTEGLGRLIWSSCVLEKFCLTNLNGLKVDRRWWIKSVCECHGCVYSVCVWIEWVCE